MTSNDDFSVAGPLIVDQLGSNTYRFSGGSVNLLDSSGRLKDQIRIVCPNLDAFVVTWDPMP